MIDTAIDPRQPSRFEMKTNTILRYHPRHMDNRGFSVVAAVLILLGCMFLAAIALPGFMRACGCEGPQAGAIRWMRLINSSQSAYSSSCAEGGYARTYEDLRRPPLTGGTPFMPLTGPDVDGYVIIMRMAPGAELPGVGCNGGRRVKGYFAEAHPKKVDEYSRFFATDQRGIVYESDKPIPEDMSGARPVQ